MRSDEINPAIGKMLSGARDWLLHEHSLFYSLDLKPILIGRNKATFSVHLPQDFLDANGYVHGGLLTIIMDSIFGLAAFTALDEFNPIATINLRTDYLTNTKAGGRVICAAECIKLRGDVAYVVGDLRAEQTDEQVATATGAFMIGTRSSNVASRL
ncbi:PaaI family thioesterase [Hyphococcus formosus]|uniref:PaaI family thioesterase n=1 Tax=Hyphococcus formosus TaxID=3143534 RepID=UPI00398A8A36